MSNNIEYRTVRIGTIKIKMFDGVVRILTDVRHVSNLRKSLISLGTLDVNGYAFANANGILKIKYGALGLMKGEKIGFLYKLIEKTITGDTAVTSFLMM